MITRGLDGRVRVWAMAFVTGVAGCGGSQKPEAESAEVQASDKEAVVAALPPVKPAPAPAGVFLRGRIRNPELMADMVTKATGLPFDWRKELREESASDRIQPLELVDVAAPVEIFAVLNEDPRRDPHFVISFGAASERAVLTELEEAQVPLTPGPEGTEFGWDGSNCVVGRAVGPAPARIACTRKAKSLAVVAPYALRGLPGEELSAAEAHFELEVEPIRQKYSRQMESVRLMASVFARQLQTDHERYDRALTDSLMGLSDEALTLADDLERLEFQVFSTEEADFQVVAAGQMRSARSWTAQSVDALSRTQTPPIDLFWRLPASSAKAYWAHTLPPQQTERMFGILEDLGAGFLESEGFSKAEVAAFEGAWKTLSSYEGPYVSAEGPLVPPSKEGSGLAPEWYLVGLQGPASKYQKMVDDLTRLLRTKTKSKAGEVVKDVSIQRRGVVRGRPGSVVYSLKFPDAVHEGLPTGGGYLAVVPDGNVSWLAFAEEGAPLDDLFASLAKADTPRVEGVDGLSTLRGQAAITSGFTRIESLVGMATPYLPNDVLGQNWAKIAQTLPYGGKVPSTFEVRGSSGSGPTVTMTYRLPREFVGDLTALLVQAEDGKYR